jgi:hypothetical protein
MTDLALGTKPDVTAVADIVALAPLCSKVGSD